MSNPITHQPLIAETVFPSIGAWSIGRGLGMLMRCLPIRIGRMRLSTLLFSLPAAPIAATVYLLQKVVGVHYRLTDEAVEQVSGLSVGANESVSIADIVDATVETRPGQAFYRAGDLHLSGSDGSRLMTLAGVPHPERIRAGILDISSSRRQLTEMADVRSVRPSVEELKAIAAKQKAEAAAKKKAAAAAKAAAAEKAAN